MNLIYFQVHGTFVADSICKFAQHNLSMVLWQKLKSLMYYWKIYICFWRKRHIQHKEQVFCIQTCVFYLRRRSTRMKQHAWTTLNQRTLLLPQSSDARNEHLSWGKIPAHPSLPGRQYSKTLVVTWLQSAKVDKVSSQVSISTGCHFSVHFTFYTTGVVQNVKWTWWCTAGCVCDRFSPAGYVVLESVIIERLYKLGSTIYLNRTNYPWFPG